MKFQSNNLTKVSLLSSLLSLSIGVAFADGNDSITTPTTPTTNNATETQNKESYPQATAGQLAAVKVLYEDYKKADAVHQSFVEPDPAENPETEETKAKRAEAQAAGARKEAISAALEANPTAKSLYEYYTKTLTSDEARASYESKVLSYTADQFNSTVTIDTAKLTNTQTRSLRAKRAAYLEAQEAQKAAEVQLQDDVQSAVKVFGELLTYLNTAGVSTGYDQPATLKTETVKSELEAFKTSITNLQSDAETSALKALVFEASDDSAEATTTSLYEALVKTTAPANNAVNNTSTNLANVALADRTFAENVASIESAVTIINKLLEENKGTEAVETKLTALKTSLETIKTSLSETASDVTVKTEEVKTAEANLVTLAKSFGIADTTDGAGDSATVTKSVLAKVLEAFKDESSATTLLAAIEAQQKAEAYYNQAATSQVLASAIAESQLAQGRYLLQSVRGQAQGAFANVFYNSKNLSVLDVTYPTLVLGGDYQIVPSTKAGAALTVSTAELELARANTYLQDIAYGFNVFVDYSENDIFATGLVGYTKHDVFGTLLGSKYDHQYNSFDFAARVGYDFDFAESGKASVAGVYQFNSLGFTKLKTHVFGVEADYKYKLDSTFELTAGLGVYFQSHNKAKVAVPSYVQVVNSTLVDFGKNAYKKSGAAVAVNLGLTSYIAKNSVLSTEFGYQRDPRGSSNYNVNVGYRFKFN